MIRTYGCDGCGRNMTKEEGDSSLALWSQFGASLVLCEVCEPHGRAWLEESKQLMIKAAEKFDADRRRFFSAAIARQVRDSRHESKENVQ